jgi:hypothetical protein
VASTSGAGASTSIATGLRLLTNFAAFDVNDTVQGQAGDVSGNPLPSPHTTADFLKSVVPSGFTPPPSPLPPPTFNATDFQRVTPGTSVSFAVGAFNDFVPATGVPQLFSANLQALANNCTPLDQRVVLVLVPPAPVGPQ